MHGDINTFLVLQVSGTVDTTVANVLAREAAEPVIEVWCKKNDIEYTGLHSYNHPTNEFIFLRATCYFEDYTFAEAKW